MSITEATLTAPDYTGWKRGDPIGYIRQDIPDFDVPPTRESATLPSCPTPSTCSSAPNGPSQA